MKEFFKDVAEPLIQKLTLKNCPGDKRVWVVRGDLIHPQVSGNKWYKLKYNLRLAQQRGNIPVLSFGGPWSNHIHALAAAGYQLGIPTIGVIRGNWRKELTPMLADAASWGMRLVFIDKHSYKQRENPQWIVSQLPAWRRALPVEADSAIDNVSKLLQSTLSGVDKLPSVVSDIATKGILIVPEGGSNAAGIKGIGEWAKLIYGVFSEPATVILPVGSGGTLAGFAKVASNHQLVGIPVLKTNGQLPQKMLSLLYQAHLSDSFFQATRQLTQWRLASERYSWGGYARYPVPLRRHVEQIEKDSGIFFDPVYTAKAVYALQDMLNKNEIATSDVVLVHTGGLQGRRGIITDDDSEKAT